MSRVRVRSRQHGASVHVEHIRPRAEPELGLILGADPDNTSAGRFVVGPGIRAAGLDLRLSGVVLEHNGEVVATADSIGGAEIGCE